MKKLLLLATAGILGAGLSFADPTSGKKCDKEGCKKGDKEISSPFIPVVDDGEAAKGKRGDKRGGPGGERPSPEERAKKLMSLDADSSGGVSLEEFAAGERFSKAPAEMREKIFAHMDADSDGQITEKEALTMKRPERGGPGGPRGGEKGGKKGGGERPERPSGE